MDWLIWAILVSNLSVTYARKAAPSLLSIVIGGILL